MDVIIVLTAYKRWLPSQLVTAKWNSWPDGVPGMNGGDIVVPNG